MQKIDTEFLPCFEQSLKAIAELEKVLPSPFLEERIMAKWEREVRRGVGYRRSENVSRLEPVN